MSIVSYYPGSGADDAYYGMGSLQTASNEIISGYYSAYTMHGVIRIPSVSAANGEIVSNAVMRFKSSRDNAGTIVLRISLAAVDNPSMPATDTDAGTMARSVGYVDWSVPTYSAGTTVTTPDLSALFETHFARVGWTSGNSLIVFLDEQTSGPTYFYSTDWDSGGSKPELQLETGIAGTIFTVSSSASLSLSAKAPSVLLGNVPVIFAVSSPAVLALTSKTPVVVYEKSTVFEWEGDSTLPRGNFTWRSKLILLPAMTNFTTARVEADFSEDQEAYFAALAERQVLLARNAAIISSGNVGGEIGSGPIGIYPVGGDSLAEVPTVGAYSGAAALTFKVYADGVLKQTVQVFSSQPFRLLGGYRSKQYAFQIEGNIAVKKIEIATSIGDLVEA